MQDRIKRLNDRIYRINKTNMTDKINEDRSAVIVVLAEVHHAF